SGENAALRTYKPQESRVLIGLRHSDSHNGYLAGEIEEARLYSRALSEKEVAEEFRIGPSVISSREMLQVLSPDQRNLRERLLAESQAQRMLLKAIPAIPLVYAGTR